MWKEGFRRWAKLVAIEFTLEKLTIRTSKAKTNMGLLYRVYSFALKIEKTKKKEKETHHASFVNIYIYIYY